nr:PREDICTED: dehydrogenase/reductase SDR family member 11-like [Megachile rotundata]
MDQWFGKLAVVTGASSGIGETVCIALLQNGVNVVGLARRVDNMEKMLSQMKNIKGKFHAIRCDLRKEQDILDAFKVVESLGGADILVNNAGLGYTEYITESPTTHMREILDVNVLAVAICTREATKSLRRRKARGHIINVNSVLGHNVRFVTASSSLYETSKHAITGMSEALRREMLQLKAPIKVTSVSPGVVKTSMPLLEQVGGEKFLNAVPHVHTKDIADGILYVLATAPHVEVNELTIAALHMGVIPGE